MFRSLAACGGGSPDIISHELGDFVSPRLSCDRAIPTVIFGLESDSSEDDGEADEASSKTVPLFNELAWGDI